MQFERWTRLTGVSGAPDSIKIDWIVQHSALQHRPILQKLSKNTCTLENFVIRLGTLFPKVENDVSLRTKIAQIPPLQKSGQPQEV